MTVLNFGTSFDSSCHHFTSENGEITVVAAVPLYRCATAAGCMRLMAEVMWRPSTHRSAVRDDASYPGYRSWSLTARNTHTYKQLFSCIFVCLYIVSRKIPTFKLSVTLSNHNRFSDFLHCWKAHEIGYKTNMTLHTSP